MNHRRAIQLLLVATLCGVAAPAFADVAQPIPDGQLLGALPSAGLSAAQLEDLVAPIALYPDALLSQVLVASTYPLEVVQARQWLQRHRNLEGAALLEEAKKERWDASVQSLVAFPDVLDTLTQDIEWTSTLGDAFLAQESDVMASVQRLRSRARTAGKLVSTSEQRVTEEVQERQTVVQIVPATTEVVYVPRYDPWYVWGAPSWSAYPPLYYAPGYAFAVGINVGAWFGGWSWGWGWGWYPNWYGGSVWVNGGWFNHCGYRYAHYDHHRHGYHGGYGPGHGGGNPGHGGRGGSGGRMAWSHDPGHRKGVPYASGRSSSRYEAASRASRSNLNASGWRGDRGTQYPSGRRTSTWGSRGGSDQGWRSPAGSSRGWGSAPSERSSARGSASESWRSSGQAPRRSESSWRSSASPRGPEQGWRSPSSSRSSDSGWRERGAAPRPYGAAPRGYESSPRSYGSSPRSLGSSTSGPSRGSSFEGSRSAPRGGADGGRGGYSGGGRSWSGSAPRGSSGSFGSGGGSRGSGGGFSGGSRSGGGSPGGGHRGGGGRH
jgi:hypothetical protein